MPIPNHIPRAQLAKEATPATTPVYADVSPSGLRTSLRAITAKASAKKAKPLPIPSANAHHTSKFSLFPDAAALATTVVSATAVMVHQPLVNRDREVKMISLATAYRDKGMDQADGPIEMIDNILAGLEGRTDFHAVLLQSRASEFR